MELLILDYAKTLIKPCTVKEPVLCWKLTNDTLLGTILLGQNFYTQNVCFLFLILFFELLLIKIILRLTQFFVLPPQTNTYWGTIYLFWQITRKLNLNIILSIQKTKLAFFVVQIQKSLKINKVSNFVLSKMRSYPSQLRWNTKSDTGSIFRKNWIQNQQNL